MANPRELLCDKKHKDLIRPILDIASLGQHKLSRREILKYIISTAGTRASEIHALLDLEMIDKARKSIVSAKNSLGKERDSILRSLERIKMDIKITLGLEKFSEQMCLKAINDNRKILKAKELIHLDSQELTRDITKPTGKSEDDVKILDFLRRAVDSLGNKLKNKDDLLKKEINLKEKIEDMNKKSDILKEITHRKLIEAGLELIDDRDICPLCEKPWNSKQLKYFLQKRLTESIQGRKEIEHVKQEARSLAADIGTYKDNLLVLQSKYISLGFKECQNEINSILKSINTVLLELSTPFERHFENNKTIDNLLRKRRIQNLNKKIEEEIEGLKYKVSPELKAWKILTKLEVLLEQYQTVRANFKQADKVSNQASLYLSCFEAARDEVLDDIFEKINNNFSNLYKELHDEDERDFNSAFRPDEAALTFEVDFYGRGMFHPGALHSEGHQDSMGVCLFLSLHNFFAKDIFGLIVLDDVMMSVDAEHRRNFCTLLLKYFPNKQFIITTHDRVWAKQLRKTQVVNSKNMIEFKWWSIEAGPFKWKGDNFWKGIEDDLRKNEVPQAAWKLRRNGEYFLSDVCDLLHAKIEFKSDGNWELGDYLKAAVSQFKKIIKKAKKSANSWSDEDKLKEVSEIEKDFKKAVDKTQCESWSINPNVHYSRWGEFQVADFKPVVRAYHDLFEIFVCKECRNILQLLVSKNKNLEALKCSCGDFYWNLSAK
jgi:hypothetical protein